MFDLKITNGEIYDFDNSSKDILDIGISSGKIVKIGKNIGEAKIIIDAEKKIVSPGFIDIHMHEETIGNTIDNDDYDIANKMLLMGVTTGVGGNCGINKQSIKEFYDFVDKNGSPINYLLFIGHNYLREQVGIEDRYRKATDKEIEQMKVLLNEAIDYGAIGLSFGIEYSPGITLDEIVKLCEPLRGKEVLLSAHYRKDAKYAIESVKELIEISKKTGIPMQISHLGSCAAYGMMNETLEVIQKAIDDGIDIEADCYPYDAFSTYIGSAVFDEGCFDLWNKSYDSILLTEEPYKGVRCNKELFIKARKEHPNMLVVAFVMNEDEVVRALKSPFMSIASDGLYNTSQGHPRGAGTFPKALSKYVREEEKISMLEALKKMTLIPAKRLGLKSKGQIKLNYDADLVIFDPKNIQDKADYLNPTLPPEGIEYVIINGEIVAKDKKILKSRLGKIIK
ncbi:N-acyl-D-amino-acid deacylase family protein [Senegalia massiliensis]|uniref:Amidohydrolase n=1 Tax=Senegalia massiliensis TaxID=1720316 RepID=A0A845R1E2_9CLOT|nr:amidohydrolase family protein [Senegalia massiliensis]NBI07328.1 amidohydrolase [Senegalia massiliensis]